MDRTVAAKAVTVTRSLLQGCPLSVILLSAIMVAWVHNVIYFLVAFSLLARMSITGEQCGSSWGVVRGPAGMQIRCIYTRFGDFEALSLDSQSLKLIPTCKNAYEMSLRCSGWTRSGSDHLRILLGLQETSR